MLQLKKLSQVFSLPTTTLKWFGAKKKKKPENQVQNEEDTKQSLRKMEEIEELQEEHKDIKIGEEYHHKTSELYQKYMKSREKALLCLDQYLLQYEFLIERQAIFLPYHSASYEVELNRYKIGKKTGYYVELPKQLRIEQGDYVFKEFDSSNEDNVVTHRMKLGSTQNVYYREHSKHWRYTDPSITDPRSIQAHSSNNVFFIIKKNGQWRFPSKLISQKDSHLTVFSKMTERLFTGSSRADVFFGEKQPELFFLQERSDLDRGKGIRYAVFKGMALFGRPSLPNQLYQDFAWVPKPLLAEYFPEQYFTRIITAVNHEF